MDVNRAQQVAQATQGHAGHNHADIGSPAGSDVADFQSALQTLQGEASGIGNEQGQEGLLGDLSNMSEEDLMALVSLLVEVLETLNDVLAGKNLEEDGAPEASAPPLSNATRGASTTGGPNNQITNVDRAPTTTGAAGGDGQIPIPAQFVETFQLGDKTITIGGDGTASQAEVQATKQTLSDMYQNSPTFQNMIDSSSDPSFEVSVGRRDDNTSWGNADGRVFLNINNLTPGNNDAFQGITAHEFAHAAADLGHGSELDSIQDRVAAEA